ncbi:traB domain-containing protein isoform X2 [Panicum hallii]|uniref:traB domain-containing protein isoform X2 n=1 Tax=Panicum hallii TaxID=206008 RepID=UPI000DF4EA60|nr:traB domain-containing protein isoform X2 [Panicum hallii]
MAAGRTPSATAASFPPPPPCFDYRAAVLADTRAAAAAAGNPALAALVESGALVRVPRRRFGPVPAWRPPDFMEPEEVWILGTSHLSPDSVADVERVLRAVQPDNIVVELCRSRAGIMYVSTDTSDEPLLKSNMFSLGGAKFFGAVNRSINLGGQSALALRLLLAVFSSKISSGANRPFGEEFRAARKVSEDIGAQLVLGDRPIEITLERAWKSLTWDQKTKLVISLFRGITSTTDTPVSSNIHIFSLICLKEIVFSVVCTRGCEYKEEKTAVSPYELYQKLSTSYPSLLQPLIHERDMFLAWSLKRSKAVNKSKTVVGVVGKGHMNGIVYALISDQGDLRFRDLVGRASSDTWVSSLIKGLVRDTIIGLVLWALYKQLQALL